MSCEAALGSLALLQSPLNPAASLRLPLAGGMPNLWNLIFFVMASIALDDKDDDNDGGGEEIFSFLQKASDTS